MMSRFFRNKNGTTAIEYAVIASLIAVAIFASIEPIGAILSGTFNNASEGMDGN